MNSASELAKTARLRSRLWGAGYRPVALKTADKMPLVAEWQLRARRTPPADAEDSPRSDHLNTGIMCDGLRVIDIDVDDGATAVGVRALAMSALGETLIRTRSNSSRCAILYRAAEGMPGKRSVVGTAGKVEVLGYGQQLHAFGPHPSGATLDWFPDSPETTPLNSLPTVTEAELDDFLAEAGGLLGASAKSTHTAPERARKGNGLGASAAPLDVAAAMAVIPNHGPADWEHWNSVGMAAWAATGGSESGFAAFCGWSEGHPAHDAAAARGRWDHYSTSPPTETGAGKLFRMAREARPDWLRPTDRAALAPDAKRPLFRPTPPASPFPMYALGKLRSAAEAIQLRTQAPAAICAQSVLATATLAVQAHRDVELPSGGRHPLTGLFACVAESGERKTTVDRIALAPVYRIEEQWRQDRETHVAAYLNDQEAWKAAREVAKKKHKGDRALIRDALDAVGKEPKPPPKPMLLVDDFSPEALVLHLRDSRPWAGVFAAEGGVLVGGHAFSSDRAMQTAALLNTLWDGNPIRRTRVLTGDAFLPGRRCSVHLMMQRVVADRLLVDPMLDGIGTLARMLIVAPESTIGTRPFREPPADCATVLRDYADRIGQHLNRPLPTAPDTADVLDPPVMKLAAEALRIWVLFHDKVERDLAEGGELHPIRPFGAKMAEHAGRLAAVLTAYAEPDAMEVDAETMACGIALVQHYAAELLRLQGASAVAPDLKLAARLLAWWQARPDPRCYLAAIYQRGLNAIGDAATANRIVKVLEDHGWVRRLPGGTVIDGAPRRDAWELVP